MRYYLTAFIFSVTFNLNAQFSDDFLDGNFTAAPTWFGETSNFEVTAEKELHLIAPSATDTSYLSIPTSLTETSWDFLVRMKFDPSGSNYARIYLMANNENLKETLNGYYVMVGNTTDEISLYRQDGLISTEIIDGIDETVGTTEVNARIKVNRDAAGNWELLRDTSGLYNYVSEGLTTDITHTSTTHFGVFCRYTSTRSNLFYFDNLGNPYVDSSPPEFRTLNVISQTTLDLHFSEPIDEITATENANYNLDGGIGSSLTATRDELDSSLVHLTFNTPFSNATNYNLTINNVEDQSGNVIETPTIVPFFYFEEEIAKKGDIIITEIFADHSPVIGLPEFEWFEVYNRSEKYYDLEGWIVTNGSTTKVLTSYILKPNEYVAILKTADGGPLAIPNYLEAPGIPTLKNKEDDIVIWNESGITIDSVHYTDEWYGDIAKKNGGWSLEIKHLNSPCKGIDNWAASAAPLGGTPGTQNSIFTVENDITGPSILSAEVIDLEKVLIVFSENMDTLIAPTFSFNQPLTNSLGEFTSKTIYLLHFNSFIIGSEYQMLVTGGADCWGNEINASVPIVFPDTYEEGDIIINEILFNPPTNASDYIEIYNNSDKILDLQELYLGNYDDDGIDNLKQISTTQFLLYPNEYRCITEDSSSVIKAYIIYGLSAFSQTDLPTYNNDSATVYLVLKDTAIIDWVHYNEKYHYALINDVKGKSLERVQINGDSNDPDNWHTAAETSNWGTPGYENSQKFSPNVTGTAALDPKIFSPNNDGFQDLITVNLQFEGINNVVDIEIYDGQGRLIRALQDNTFVGNTASFIWDGINDEGEKAEIGTYVFLVSGRTATNERFQYKLVAVLASKL